MNPLITKRIRVYGIVQGVGFRPTVSRHAAEAGVRGTVCNCGPYVEIFAQGTPQQLAHFLDALEHRPPSRAAILKIDVKPADDCAEFSDFSIIESAKTKGEIFISPDIAICEACKEELYDPENRRYLHPFINCTCCGPRMTILDALPYDRERTSMKEFPMCPDCAEEYYNPKTRRYDAQPVCCNKCGPEVYLLGRTERGRDAIQAARSVIRQGGIAAVKGIGGFHLCCDATNQDAVMLLRQRKNRPMKPFAVMMRDEAAVKQTCVLSPAQEEILTGHQKPILLLEKKESHHLADAIAPDNPKLGVMLPYTPLHLLLFDYPDGATMPDALIMTSGNISGAPICRDDREAESELGHLSDVILSHNRNIRIRADDTVMDFYKEAPYMIRRSRGYAPLPFLLSGNLKGQVLAIGGELKNAFCIGVNGMFYPSPYVGDLEDMRTVDALRETVDRFQTLLETAPALVACDLHPDYNSTAVAKELGLPIFPVQHHYAHILSCMAEHDVQEPVIGVPFDGTGYGTDGTIWGGEILWADYSGFQRLGHIQPFLQAGGDSSAREGWRIAVSIIQSLYSREEALNVIKQLHLCDSQNANVQLAMLEHNINCVPSTSAGRLFDAVSAILGIRTSSTFEGEAATALQFRAEHFLKNHPDAAAAQLPLLIEDDSELLLSTQLLVKQLIERRLFGENSDALAWEFHAQLSAQIAAACCRACQLTQTDVVALSGGVFQNTLLLSMVESLLNKTGHRVLTHCMVPPNDGGIALGQAAAAMYHLSHQTN